MLFRSVDERQKHLALQSVFIQIDRRPVRGRDDDDTTCEQRLEKTPDDHGIGNIKHLKLVEAQQCCLFGEASSEGGSGVDGAAVPLAV